MGHSRPFLIIFVFSIQLTVNIQYNFLRWLDSNCGPLESKVTALPTESPPLPLVANFKCSIIIMEHGPLKLVSFFLLFSFLEISSRWSCCCRYRSNLPRRPGPTFPRLRTSSWKLWKMSKNNLETRTPFNANYLFAKIGSFYSKLILNDLPKRLVLETTL